MYIRAKSAVIASDFVPVMQDCIQRHHITSSVYDHDLPDAYRYLVDCTTPRSWNFNRYLSHAEIRSAEHG